MSFIGLLWIIQKPDGIGSVSNKYKPSLESAFCACISSTIRAVIHIALDYQVNYNCFNEPFAVSPCKDLYWDMHGLIFETSIWLLAGSTRFYQKRNMKQSTVSRCSLPRRSTLTHQNDFENVYKLLSEKNKSKNLDSPERRRQKPTQRHLGLPSTHTVTESPSNVAPLSFKSAVLVCYAES